MQEKSQGVIFTRLYLIRHGQTEWNKQKKIQGSLDIPLNKRGIQQAEAVAQRMYAHYPFDLIFSSPAERALKTAETINQYTNRKIIVDPNLIEIDFGSLTNHTLDDLGPEQEEYIRKFNHFIFSNRESGTTRPELPQGESIAHIEKRIDDFIKMVLSHNSGKKIAVVSHGSFLKCMLTVLCGGSVRDYIPYWFENASISIIDLNGKFSVLRVLNETSHLEQELGFVTPKIM
jgi:broad specificity phosphatase PhoE